MRNLIMTAALILSLALTTAGCGENTADHRTDGENNSIALQNEARGGPDSNGSYRADDHGRVGKHDTPANDGGQKTDLGRDLRDAGEDLAQDARNAAKDVGDAMKDTMDNTAGTGKNPEINANNSANPSVN